MLQPLRHCYTVRRVSEVQQRAIDIKQNRTCSNVDRLDNHHPMPDVVPSLDNKRKRKLVPWRGASKLINFTTGTLRPIGMKLGQSLAFCSSTIVSERRFSQALATGEHLDLRVHTGDNLKDALVGLAVVAGNGTILAFREDHAREGAR